ncbi:MAG: head decoration protein [Armatimonadota bacterium]
MGNLYETESMTPDNLIAGVEQDLVSIPVTLIQGSGALARGAVLGKITKGAATGAVTKGAGVASGTGDGVLGSISIGKEAKVGIYLLTCIAAASNAGTFSVVDPDGVRLKDATVAVAYTGNHVRFTIADGANDFVAGDQFSITVAAGSGKYKPVNSTNLDGSHTPECVLAEAVTVAADADSESAAYVSGEFNERALTFGGSDTVATHKVALMAMGIIVRPTVNG